MALLAGILLGDLQLDGLIGPLETAKERRNGFAHLEVNGAMLYLKDDVLCKLAIERMKDVVGRLGPVVLGLSPVEMVVVYEGAIENDAAVPGQCPGNDIGGICGCPTIGGRTEPALRIGLYNEPGKIRNTLINLLDFLVPPGSNAGI